jgi:type II secretory pathway component PulC
MVNLTLTSRHMLGINTLIALLLLGTIFYAGWNWHGDWLISHQELKSNPVQNKPDDSATMVAAIPNAHIFGRSLATVGAVPLSNLQFKVTGIAKIEHEKQSGLSKAYISVSGGPSKIFKVGDNLPYGVKVYDITPDAVILENDGHLEKLTLAREKLEFKAKTSVERQTDDA